MLTLRWLGWAVIAVTLFFSLVLLSFRYWLLPDVDRYRPYIAAAISKVAGQEISIERIDANWDGLRPYLRMYGVQVMDRRGLPALILTELDGTLSWRSWLYGEPRFHKIKIDQPALIIRRDIEGVTHFAGMVFDQDQSDSGFLDWLLRQRQLTVHNADIYWLDELRGAPLLYLKQVALHMYNKDGQHRFGFRATPPAEVADPLDIRGDFIGNSVNTLHHWQGRLFLQFNHVDLAVLQKWVSFPEISKFDRGRGAFRAWIGIDEASITYWKADVILHAARMQWAEDLPVLNLAHLRGRLGWKNNSAKENGDEWSAQQLSVAIENELFAAPANILWQRQGWVGDIPEENKIQLDDVDVGMFASIVRYLPIDRSLQKQLGELSPEGVIDHAQIDWQGNWAKPIAFNVQGRFSDIALSKFGALPAMSGMSGSISLNEQEGALNLDSRHAKITLFEKADKPLELEQLAAQLDWQIIADQQKVLLKFDSILFANRHMTGTIRGRYLHASDKPGSIDFDGEVDTAEIGYVHNLAAYLIAPETVQNWLGKASASGRMAETRFHIQGDLGESYSERLSQLVFGLETKIADASVNLPNGWPKISGLQAKLSLNNDQLEMTITQARITAILLKNLQLRLADIRSPAPKLLVNGEAEGETQSIIHLLEKDTFNTQTVDFLTKGKVAGKGKLQLELAMPFSVERDDERKIELAGRYQFIDNEIDWGHGMPTLSKVNGIVNFTQSNLVIEQVSAQALGGPIMINSTYLPDGGLRIAATGRADFDRLQPVKPDQPTNTIQLWVKFLRGSTDWSATIDLREKGVDITVASSLAGVASTLPEPFSKTAEEVIPFNLVKKSIDPIQEALQFRYGEVVNAEIQRKRDENGNYYPTRGVLNFHVAPVDLPQDAVTLVRGHISALEWDRWQALFKQHDAISAQDGGAGRGIKSLLTNHINFDLKMGRLDFIGSRFNDFSFEADKRGEQWHTSVVSREVVGDIDWDSGITKRKAFARLKKLVMPEAVTETGMADGKKQPKDWPNLDLQAEEFVVAEKPLGKLVLMARQEREGWFIDQLKIVHPDSVLLVKGLWQNRIVPFDMRAESKLQVHNIGKFLARLGYAGRIARGEGELEGMLEWTGEPFSVDFPSLSGELNVTARRGQFSRFKPGVSKLLGIFDLKSIPRRLSLDFYDVFSQGFGFENISGDVRINRGNAVTDELQIAGSAAHLVVSGEIDLVDEAQALKVKMFPSLGLATPVVGIASMIATQSLKDPFDRVLFNEYAITGTWDEPIVTKSQNSQEIKESLPELKHNGN